MNTAEFYGQPHQMRPPTPPHAARPAPSSTSSELGRFGDPSLRGSGPTTTSDTYTNARATRWVRPNELPDAGMRALARVIDKGFAVQARVVRATVRSAETRLRRPAPEPPIAGRPTPASAHDGLGL